MSFFWCLVQHSPFYSASSIFAVLTNLAWEIWFEISGSRIVAVLKYLVWYVNTTYEIRRPQRLDQSYLFIHFGWSWLVLWTNQLSAHQRHLQHNNQYFTCLLGGKYLVFVSSRSVKMRGFSFLSLYKSLFIFQFLNVKMYNYGKENIIVNFIIKKLKKNTISSKSIKTKFSHRENLAFSVLRKVCLFFNFWIIKCTNVLRNGFR